MVRIRQARRPWMRDGSGTAAVEYALVASAIGLAMMVAVGGLTPKLVTVFTDLISYFFS